MYAQTRNSKDLRKGEKNVSREETGTEIIKK